MKIACFQALKLGDFICVTPALRLLRESYPDAEISFVARPAMLSAVKRFGSYIDRIYLFPGSPFIPEQHADQSVANSFNQKMRERDFNILFNFHGIGSQSTTLLNDWHAEKLVTFDSKSDSSMPVILKYMHMVESHSGRHRSDPQTFFPLSKSDLESADALRINLNLSTHEYVCIHPGSAALNKRWPLDSFVAVAKHLKKAGAKIIITGNAAEAGLARDLQAKLGAEVAEVASMNLDVGVMAAFIASSRLVLCNDTGILHLAAALKIPTISIFQSKDLMMKWHSTYGAIHASYVASAENCLDDVTGATLLRWHASKAHSPAIQEVR